MLQLSCLGEAEQSPVPYHSKTRAGSETPTELGERCRAVDMPLPLDAQLVRAVKTPMPVEAYPRGAGKTRCHPGASCASLPVCQSA